MEIWINVVGFDAVLAKLDMRQSLNKKAAVQALNATGYDVIDALKEEMRFAFDRPTPYTLNSLRLQKATIGNMRAKIAPAEWAGKGTPAKDYLGPEIFGGPRKQKRSERALQAMGVLPRDMYIVPGSGATLDAYGNQSLGEIRQILSWFGAAGMRLGYNANMTAKKKSQLMHGAGRRKGYGITYFAITSGKSNLRRGIYRQRRTPGFALPPQPVMIFIKNPQYRKLYRWHWVARRVSNQMFERNLRAAIASGGDKQ
ncbi:MAG: hypothetical protein WC373_12155 [Smithella sp.]|jgi:hypothetical protein